MRAASPRSALRPRLPLTNACPQLNPLCVAPFVRRYCDPSDMAKHELRNEQPAAAERTIELLVYGVFAGYEGDKGFYSTAWLPLEDILMSVPREVVSAKLLSFRDGLTAALDSALLARTADPPLPATADTAAAAAGGASPPSEDAA